MAPIRMIMVGGFLGAGKTTLIAQAAGLLAQRGERVGIITNDQAPGLADTGALTGIGFGVDEVSGGCFCCHFDELVEAWDRIIAQENPSVIIGEPVGSCTDVSATVFQPIKKLYADKFDLAPLTVLTDPRRLAEALNPETAASLPPDVLYIYLKQLEEADLIVINKVDLIGPDEQTTLRAALAQRLSRTPVLTMSALRGDGVSHWLAELGRMQGAGTHITEVDYDVYARGEAALGWLNASVELDSTQAEPDWQAFARRLMDDVLAVSQHQQSEIAHFKIHLAAGEGWLQANLTSNRERPSLIGHGTPSGAKAHLIINARCHLAPDALERMIKRALAVAAGDEIKYEIATLESFSPARPEPTHRYENVI